MFNVKLGHIVPRDREVTSGVIACDKRAAFAQGSEATKQSILSSRGEMDCFASLAMTGLSTVLFASRAGAALPSSSSRQLIEPHLIQMFNKSPGKFRPQNVT